MVRGMHGGVCAWWGVCMVGHVWQGVCMVGACVAGGMHGKRDSHWSGQYISYWNAFLLFNIYLLLSFQSLYLSIFHCTDWRMPRTSLIFVAVWPLGLSLI